MELEKSVEESSSVPETTTNTEPDEEYRGDLMLTVRIVLLQDLVFTKFIILFCGVLRHHSGIML